MASQESSKKILAPEIIDLTNDSDEEEESYSPHEDATFSQPVIKVEPSEDKANPCSTDQSEHYQKSTSEQPHKEPSHSALLTATPSRNSAEPGTAETCLPATDDASDKLAVVSDASGFFGSKSTFTPSNDKLQPITADVTAQVHSDHSFNASSHVDVSPADEQDDSAFGAGSFQGHCHENIEVQGSTYPQQNSDLPELPIIELPVDIDGLTPEEAIRLYTINKSSFDEEDDNDGETERHQTSSYVAQADITVDEDDDLILERAIAEYNRENSSSHDYNSNNEAHEPHQNSSYVAREDTAVNEDVDTMDWVTSLDEDRSMKSDKEAAKFARLKEEYIKKTVNGTANDEDSVRFIAAQAAERKRLGDLERSQRQIEDEHPSKGTYSPYQDEDSLFIPEVPGRPGSPKRKIRAPPKPRNRVNAQETREAMAVGNNSLMTRKRRAPATCDEPRPRKKRITKAGPSKPAKKRTKQPILSNLNSLGRSNIVQEAQANVDKPDMPTFSAKDKNKALQQLIASIPSAENGAFSSDRAAVLDATKKFNGRGSVRSDGQGGWKLRGMRSSLYNHQLLGAAFLRDRENGTQRPFGGLVCDEMGFGKTIQMM